MNLVKVAETSTTITLGWTPPAGVGGYVLYAAGQVVSVATRNLKDGSPRVSAKFSKTSPGPPFHVVAVVRSSAGAFAVDVGAYAGDQPPPPPPPSGDYPASYFTGPLGTANPLPPKGRKFLGIFPNTIGFDWSRQKQFIAEREAAIGRRYDVVMTAHHPAIYAENRLDWLGQNGYIPLIAGAHWGPVADTAAGSHDAQVRSFADSFVGKTVCLIRLWSEFDMPWLDYTSVGHEQAFVDAWRRVVSIFEQRGASNVGFYLCPNEGVDRASADKVFSMLRDEDFDWVGVDWYNWCSTVSNSGCYSTWMHPGWAEFWELFQYTPGSNFSNRHDAWGPRKPFFIGETNTVWDADNPSKKGNWYRNVTADPRGIKAMTHCIGVSPYDADVSSVEGGAANFLVDYPTSQPSVFDGFKAMARDPVWYCRGS